MGYTRFEKYGGVFQCSDKLFEMYSEHSDYEVSTYCDLLFTYYSCLTGKHHNRRSLEWLSSEGLTLVDGKLNLKEYENSTEFLHSSLGYNVMRNEKKETRKLLEQLKTRKV